MLKIKVSDAIQTHCQEQVEKFNFGKRYIANGNHEQQLTGLIGQSVVMNMFDFGFVNGEIGFDNGTDLVFNKKNIDVKTMGRKTEVKRNYTNNFLKLQDYFNTDIYIFCSYHKTLKEVTICGWIEKKDFIKKRKFFPKGTTRYRSDGSSFSTFADLYEIDISDLNDIESAEDLKNQIANL